jgi:hypothetical protein
MNLTTTQLAAALKISRQRVNELGRLGKIHREKDGGWDPAKVNLALGANLDIHQVSRARGETTPPNRGGRPRKDAPAKVQATPTHQARSRREVGPSPGTPAHAQFMKTQAQAAQEMMLAKKMDGSLVERAGMQRTWNAIAMTIKTKLLSVGARLAPMVAVESDAALCKAILDQDMRSILEDLAQTELSEFA